ncbi:MAG: Lysine/cadaverine antiporter membrane protein CadB [Rhodanobacteraceae bacterium]|jgi:APA family basic amino acid/polyamine antiporter|nr:MAG: Lysine/cadaverine antiporter membrane protein CadB [Rhodanobacteraceae bacterium]
MNEAAPRGTPAAEPPLPAAGAHCGPRIGFWTCTALVVGNVIGMGIFLLPSSLAPYGFNGLIGWAVVMAGSLVLAVVFAKLARVLPDAAGPFDYIRSTLGELPAYLAMWAYWVSVWLTNTALATGVVGYMEAAVGPTHALPPMGLALALLWAMVVVNLFGVRAGGGVQIVTTVLKLVPMAAVIALGAWLLFSTPHSYVAHLPTTPISLSSVAATVTLTLFAMMGIESATMPAAHVENPGRTIPRATMAGAVLAVVVYVLVCTIPMLLIPQHELAGASAPFSLLMDRLLANGSGRWIALFVMISGLGALNGWMLLGGELTRTMAAGGVLPAILARNNRFGAPVNALLATGVFSSVTVVMSYSKSLVSAFTFLVQMVTASVLPFYLGCGLALGVLWFRRTPGCRSRNVLLMSLVCTLCMVLAFVGTGERAFLLTLALIAAGLPVYFYTRWRNGTAASLAGSAE